MIINVLQEKISTKDRVVRNPNIKHKCNSWKTSHPQTHEAISEEWRY